MRNFTFQALTVAVMMAPFVQAVDRQQARTVADRDALVLEGCLQNADHSGPLAATPAATSASPVTAGAIANNPELPPYVILTGARPPGRNARLPPVGTAGRAGSTRTADGTVTPPSDRDTPKTYVLVGNQDGFAVYNRHRVEITGTIAPPAEPGEEKGAPGGGEPLRSGTERLRVVSIRSIAENCSQR
jgi:hypothetical protein